MFMSDQIITTTKLIKQFRKYANKLKSQPQALLITQKSNNPLVLVNAEIFEGLVAFHQQYEGQPSDPRTNPGDYLIDEWA